MTGSSKRTLILTIAGVSLAVIVLFAYLFLRNANEPQLVAEEPEEVIEEVIYLDEFGVTEGGYVIHSEVVRRGQTLSHILSRFDLGPVMIDRIARKMIDEFNPRRIRAGNAYHGYYNPDTTNTLKYFVYEISNLDYVKVFFADSILVERGQKEVTTQTREASGIIQSSLWNALSANKLSQQLAIRLSEVLAWEVDFHRLERGDRFKVVYQENFVGEESIGIPRVDAVYFVHRGREVHGFNFEHDTISGFFNQEADNLRKVFLKAPLEFGRISSRYSHSRMHPVLGHRRPHYGTDYAAPRGTPILAVGDGVVTRTAYTSGNGNYVRIRHNSVYETQYLHMSRFAKGMRPGTKVKQGDVIGYVGATGLATGPHVCFRFWKNGQQVDHLKEEFPSADPLPEDYHEMFFELRDSLIIRLENIAFKEEVPEV